MRKEVPITDTIVEATCDLCGDIQEFVGDVEKCPGCKRDFCRKNTCYKSLYPLDYVFSYPNALCSICYPKIDMFIDKARQLQKELDDKISALKTNIKQVLNYVK